IPSGGYFSGTSAISQSGLLQPAQANTGTNILTYANGVGTCVASQSATFIITPSPTVTASGNFSVCLPGSATLVASGANSYNWSTGSTSPTLILTPSASTMIVLTGSNGSCSDSTTVSLQVAAMPNVTVSGDTSICAGQSVLLKAGGASAYLWSTSVSGDSARVSPALTSAYTVTGATSPFCMDTKTIIVNVIPVPLIQVSGNFSICPGETALLVASGAQSYSWSTGANGGVISVMPVHTTTYMVTGINPPANCAAGRTVTVTVDPCSGIDERSINGISVYPNPVNNELFVESGKQVSIRVYNEIGMLILEKSLTSGKNKIITERWNQGVYFIRISDTNKNSIHRIVKSD
ncbi:MAG TPA: T9SS type A sorting domain-containing protein, partial [Chitinophagaceae bacterium]|nr:T9SS type A sorting domain-containing protein [Chitinophagaceae bacterium]